MLDVSLCRIAGCGMVLDRGVRKPSEKATGTPNYISWSEAPGNLQDRKDPGRGVPVTDLI